jgi:hypothetical protein
MAKDRWERFLFGLGLSALVLASAFVAVRMRGIGGAPAAVIPARAR